MLLENDDQKRETTPSVWMSRFREKEIDPADLPVLIKKLKADGKTIVTLNGSFDLLHAGHLHMIFEASALADVLIVALNTDASIQQYKSKDRPIIPLAYRMQMMAAIECIDYVTWFNETDPRNLLSIIQPDVHANGSEYGYNCIEAETVKKHGGRVHIISLIPNLSTSQIIEKIRSIPKEL